MLLIEKLARNTHRTRSETKEIQRIVKLMENNSNQCACKYIIEDINSLEDKNRVINYFKENFFNVTESNNTIRIDWDHEVAKIDFRAVDKRNNQ